FFSSRRRHTRFSRDWSSDVCSSDLVPISAAGHSFHPPVVGMESPHPGAKQQSTVVGTVTASSEGLRLAGVSVSVKGTSLGVSTEIGRASCRESGETKQGAESDQEHS